MRRLGNALCRVGLHKSDTTMRVMAEGHIKARVLFEATCRRCGKISTTKTFIVN